jgi:hypothetical protein
VIEPIPFAGLVEFDDKLEKKYCSSCGSYRDPHGGQMVQSNKGKVNRFKCVFCVKKMSAPRYAGKGTSDATRTNTTS